MPAVFVSIVTYESGTVLTQCLAAVLASTVPVSVSVIDNASTVPPASFLPQTVLSRITLRTNQYNLGFCAAHNQAVGAFLKSPAQYLLLLNPDLAVQPDLIEHLRSGLERHPQAGLATPRLLRADLNLRPVAPQQLDAAGMEFTTSYRHFDRGAGTLDTFQHQSEEFVFGGTGACLFMRRAFVEQALFSGLSLEDAVDLIYPQLAAERAERALLFDEAFFAYREDAELALRAKRLGWKCLYVPRARGFHVRKVVPERREELPKELNLLGVRNRFLLQLNHIPPLPSVPTILYGLLFRNVLVICGVLLKERSSLKAFYHLLLLRKRARQRNSELQRRSLPLP